MKYQTSNIREDPNIGLYGFATDKYCLLGRKAGVEKTLNVREKISTAYTIELSGIFITGNSSGIMAPESIEDEEKEKLEKITEVLFIDTNFTALGNLCVMNDSGILISGLLRKHKNEIEKFFGLKTETATVARSKVIGTCVAATNRGCIFHPKTTEAEQKIIEKIMDVSGMPGTVSFGSPFVKAGILANSRGFATSKQTSGHELGRISEALGFV